MEENIAFISSMLDKGKMEDLSIFTKAADRVKFLKNTQTIINDFVPLPQLQAMQSQKVQQNQNEQLPNDQKELTKQNDTQQQAQEEALVQQQQIQPTGNTPSVNQTSIKETENTGNELNSQALDQNPMLRIENIQKSDYWYSEYDIKNILEANID
ncbi:MAG: hypothetical protein O7C59_11750 [Rickettsia endosymbiont of Ixodes persulcatus]|nr:hypothetical protein [Rickettsia endosymbiont of Ixodes persulcatus]MCZ6908742.1 hypothetical protein [Rickettsia endosymbiont of Ixodes persulcatus]MCZ6915023.1 hypothetical protein [Rickettsia endosymbiont of Ixodes persulcatus]